MNGTAMNAPTRPSLWQNFILCLTKKYIDFSGTASRREFWGFYLFLFIFTLIFTIAGIVMTLMTLPMEALRSTGDQAMTNEIIYAHFSTFITIVQLVFLVFCPASWSVIIRRLRDAGFPTAWGYIYMGAGILGIIKWSIFDRFQYPMGASLDYFTLFLAIAANVLNLLILILACFPSQPKPEKLPE